MCNDASSTVITLIKPPANPSVDTTTFTLSNTGFTTVGLSYLFPTHRQGIIGIAVCGCVVQTSDALAFHRLATAVHEFELSQQSSPLSHVDGCVTLWRHFPSNRRSNGCQRYGAAVTDSLACDAGFTSAVGSATAANGYLYTLSMGCAPKTVACPAGQNIVEVRDTCCFVV